MKFIDKLFQILDAGSGKLIRGNFVAGITCRRMMLFAFITSGSTTDPTFEIRKLSGASEAKNEVEMVIASEMESFFS